MGRLTNEERRHSVMDLLTDIAKAEKHCSAAFAELAIGHKRRSRDEVGCAITVLTNVKHTLKMMLSHRKETG
jgi:hypothetical protein